MGKKIFSGVQPTGNLHLGNYLGAIKNFVDLNNDKDNKCIFCVVDLHAITVKQDPKELKNNIRETVATFIASGIDPKKSIIFNQSSVAAHAEGAWILSCVARMGWLNRMTQFKEKAGKGSSPGDISFIISGNKKKTLTQLGALRIEVAERFGLRNNGKFEALWVTDFPLFEWDEDSKSYHSMHHPFTSPVNGIITDNPADTFANAYDLVINGNEIGGGSIRIHNKELQQQVFSILGFSEQEALEQFGFLLNAFKYGAPPHGGIAFGLDRLVAVMNQDESIRDYIAFPKNNSGRDVMIDSPSKIDNQQLDDLNIKLK